MAERTNIRNDRLKCHTFSTVDTTLNCRSEVWKRKKENISRKQHDQESSVSSRNTNYNGRYIIIQTHRWPSEMTASSNELLLITYGYKSSTAEQSKASQSRPLNSIMDIVLAGTLLSIQSRHSYNRQWWHTENTDMRFCTIQALRKERAMITQ